MGGGEESASKGEGVDSIHAREILCNVIDGIGEQNAERSGDAVVVANCVVPSKEYSP